MLVVVAPSCWGKKNRDFVLLEIVLGYLSFHVEAIRSIMKGLGWELRVLGRMTHAAWGAGAGW